MMRLIVLSLALLALTMVADARVTARKLEKAKKVARKLDNDQGQNYNDYSHNSNAYNQWKNNYNGQYNANYQAANNYQNGENGDNYQNGNYQNGNYQNNNAANGNYNYNGQNRGYWNENGEWVEYGNQQDADEDEDMDQEDYDAENYNNGNGYFDENGEWVQGDDFYGYNDAEFEEEEDETDDGTNYAKLLEVHDMMEFYRLCTAILGVILFLVSLYVCWLRRQVSLANNNGDLKKPLAPIKTPFSLSTNSKAKQVTTGLSLK